MLEAEKENILPGFFPKIDMSGDSGVELDIALPPKKRLCRQFILEEASAKSEIVESVLVIKEDSDSDQEIEVSLRTDQSTELKKDFFCSECDKSYTTRSNLNRHEQIHRPQADPDALKCPDCGKVYLSRPAFEMHKKTHKKDFHCEYDNCGKSFSRPWLLKSHIRSHTGERLFDCLLCNASFADKSNMRAHMQTHSSATPFKCDQCNRAFKLKQYLKKHRKNVHFIN